MAYWYFAPAKLPKAPTTPLAHHPGMLGLDSLDDITSDEAVNGYDTPGILHISRMQVRGYAVGNRNGVPHDLHVSLADKFPKSIHNPRPRIDKVVRDLSCTPIAHVYTSELLHNHDAWLGTTDLIQSVHFDFSRIYHGRYLPYDYCLRTVTFMTHDGMQQLEDVIGARDPKFDAMRKGNQAPDFYCLPTDGVTLSLNFAKRKTQLFHRFDLLAMYLTEHGDDERERQNLSRHQVNGHQFPWVFETTNELNETIASAMRRHAYALKEALDMPRTRAQIARRPQGPEPRSH
ncbi:MAG: hypothetical protein ABIH41_07165 [Nanoarchaeota archaeon]